MYSQTSRSSLSVSILRMVAVLTFAGVCLSPGAATAACPQGNCDTGCVTSYWWYSSHHWREGQMPVPYYINLNGASTCTGDEFQAVVRAMHNWENLHQTFWSTCYKGNTNKHSTAHSGGLTSDGYNVISWENLGTGSPLPIGRSFYWYSVTGDSILEADVTLNDAISWSAFKADTCAADCYDVENVVAHELGHWFYLGHSCDVVATMYCYTDTLETIRRTPEECDVKGMQGHYSHSYGDARILPGCWPASLADDILTNPVLGDLNRDGREEVVFATEDGKVHVVLGSADEAGGWPLSLGARTESSPALGDVDADGWMEVVIGSESDSVYVFNYNGTPQDNWPKGTKNDVKSSPAIGDVDADGNLDVVCASTDSCVYAWDGSTGNAIPGWPVKLGNGIPLAGPALADLNGDDSLEVIISGYDNYVYALKSHGANLTGWPKFTGSKVYERVAVGDIDGDSQFEVVAVAPCDTVYAWNANGSVCSGWPVYLPCLLGNSAPSLGNLDADAALEVVFGSDFDSVYAYNGDGSRLSGWPKYAGGKVKGSPVIADIDADNAYEVVVANDAGKVYAFNGNGTSVSANWPKTLPQQGYLRSPAIGDINNDSELDLVVGSGTPTYLYAYSLGTVMDADAYQWRMYGHDWNRTSRYGFAPSAPSVFFFGDLVLDLSNWDVWSFGGSFIDLTTVFNSPPYSMGVSGYPAAGSGAMAQSVSITPDFSQPYELRFAFTYDSFMMNNWIVFGHARIRFMDMYSPLYFDIAGDWSNLIPSGSPFNSYCYSGSFTQFRIAVDPAVRTITVYADDYPVASVEYLASVVPSERILIEDSMYEDQYLYGFFDDFEVHGYLPPAVGVEPAAPEAPLLNVLYQSYPNPMNPLATIKYSVKETGRVTLTIYDVAGRSVRVLVDEEKQASAGPYSVMWDGKNDAGRNVASGVYFCEMKARSFSSAKKIVVLR